MAQPSGNRKINRGAAAGAPPVVSARWLLGAVLLAGLGAVACVWVALSLLFWQGSWQLLYHPVAAIARTPASAGLAFDEVAFATTEDGVPQLKGWWISAGPGARRTAIYLHGADGNIGDTVDALARLHAAGANVLAFDYRGYGQSSGARPSEAGWKQDAESALQYLIGTRHVAAGSIVLTGQGLGANLALETAAKHPELAGVALDEPLDAPTDLIFRDPRAALVPAHWLVRDRWAMTAPATDLRIPSLWLYPDTVASQRAAQSTTARVSSPKMVVWVPLNGGAAQQRADALARWLDGLPAR